MDDVFKWIMVGFIIIFAGIVVMTMGLLMSAAKGGGKVEGGGVVVIGPIPIAFGTSSEIVKTLMIIAGALTLMLLVLYYVFTKYAMVPR